MSKDTLNHSAATNSSSSQVNRFKDFKILNYNS